MLTLIDVGRTKNVIGLPVSTRNVVYSSYATSCCSGKDSHACRNGASNEFLCSTILDHFVPCVACRRRLEETPRRHSACALNLHIVTQPASAISSKVRSKNLYTDVETRQIRSQFIPSQPFIGDHAHDATVFLHTHVGLLRAELRRRHTCVSDVLQDWPPTPPRVMGDEDQRLASLFLLDDTIPDPRTTRLLCIPRMARNLERNLWLNTL